MRVVVLLLTMIAFSAIGQEEIPVVTSFNYSEVNVNVSGIDLGGGVGLEVNDALYVSVFQKYNFDYRALRDVDYTVTGLDVCYNVAKKEDWLGVGFGARIGFVDFASSKVYIEPYGMVFQNNEKRNIQHKHSVGIVMGFICYNYAIQFGDFRKKKKQ